MLRAAVREIEAHAAEAGWDQPARLYALVPTADLLVREPALAAAMGLDEADAAGSLTPVEQDDVPADTPLEARARADHVAGRGVRLRRRGRAAGAARRRPTSSCRTTRRSAEQYAAEHPDRQEVRIVAGATRDGSTYCALRLRAHDDALSVLESPDLVPALLELVRSTLEN